MDEEVFILDVLGEAVSKMVVQDHTDISKTLKINYSPGSNSKIIESLRVMDGTSLSGFKYPLIAAVMPISEKMGSGYIDVTFPKIVIAHITKTNTLSEPVLDKYTSNGVFKTILRPCKNELIKQIAWSTFTNTGDPDAYEYTSRDLPCQQPIGDGLTDFVDIIEILNLKAIIFPQIKTCKS